MNSYTYHQCFYPNYAVFADGTITLTENKTATQYCTLVMGETDLYCESAGWLGSFW